MGRDPAIQAIDEAMAAQGRSRADLGRLLGLDSSQVSRIFTTKKTRRRIQLHEMQRIEQWLGLRAAQHHVAQILPMPGMVPLYGWVGAASENRLVVADDNLLGFVQMHPAQANLRNPFALQVADVSMVPRYEPGENVYIAPNQWPQAGKDIVIITREGHGYLKRFLRRDATVVVTRQLNPDEERLFKLEDIVAVHAVVGRA